VNRRRLAHLRQTRIGGSHKFENFQKMTGISLRLLQLRFRCKMEIGNRPRRGEALRLR
jgi:hypothetical protein